MTNKALIYADASWNPWSGRGGIGWIIIVNNVAHTGSKIIRECNRVPGSSSSKGMNADITALELFALHSAIRIAKNLGAKSYKLFSDNQAAVRAVLNESYTYNPQCRRIVKSIIETIGNSHFKIRWIKGHDPTTFSGQAHDIADGLARKVRAKGEKLYGPHYAIEKLREPARIRR